MTFTQKLGKAQAHLYNLWLELRTDDCLPRKRDIGMRELKYFTPFYSTVHLNADGLPAVLRSGTGLDELWGRNISGKTIADISAGRGREAFAHFMHQMLECPCGGLSADIFTTKSGNVFERDFLYLPIQTKNDGVALAVMTDRRGLGMSPWGSKDEASISDRKRVHSTEFFDIGFGLPGDTVRGVVGCGKASVA